MITPEPSELQELVRELHRLATPWQPAGLGSRLSWGPPVAPGSSTVSCRQLRGIVEHSPGDFTVTVQAGTPLVELQEELAHHRQWLALDWPWGSGPGGKASGSLGGLVARGLAGGLRQRYLGVRDQLIGIGLLRADGTAARAGGKVVKNVAGYDLMRLFTGSWGSLGLITELTLRTFPHPPQRRGLLLQGDLSLLAARKGPLRLYVRPQALRLEPPVGPAQEPGRLVLSGARVVDVLYSGGEVDYVVDRIRENVERYSRNDMGELINVSINETLSRTLATSFTTMLAMAAFLILGGSVIPICAARSLL